jgi:2-octaprenylphenol hydroxylase
LADLDHDVAVIGGGMVGAALALALAQRDFSVVLLEASEPALSWDAASHDLRVSAITRASQRLLDNLGVWQVMAADRMSAYEHMHVWDRAGFGEIHFSAADLGEPDLGHIVENRVIVRALWQALQAQGIRLRVPTRLVSLEADEQVALLGTSDGLELRVGLVVGADGAHSQVRELAGIGVRSHPYEQHAVVATVHAELGNQSTAWQRFMPDGPLALLPMQSELFSIVWSTGSQQAERLCAMPEPEFNALLTETSEARLGQLTLAGARAAFPLRLQHADQYVRPGLALVGDAAHVIHPLAGQGVNLGFLDVGALVDALRDGRAHGHAPGALRTLRVYERGRKGHNTATQLTMDAFKHLFGNDFAPVALLRNLGLGVAGRLPPLRRLFERVALGDGVELPTLCRPADR